MAAAPGLALLALLAALRAADGALNVRELSEMAYGLEILREPVLAGQVTDRGPRGAQRRAGHGGEWGRGGGVLGVGTGSGEWELGGVLGTGNKYWEGALGMETSIRSGL